MICCYDLKDNLVTIFDNYKEVAKYFDTSVEVIKTHMCRVKKGKVLKKRDKKCHQWFILMKIKED